MFCTCTVQLAHKKKPNKVLISHKKINLTLKLITLQDKRFVKLSVYADNSSNIEIKF